MGETTEQIERQIREAREDLSENFSELEHKVKNAVDWRAQFEEHPGTMLAIAFGGGMLLSGLLPSIESHRKSAETFSYVEPNSEPDTEYYPAMVPERYAEKASQTSKTLGALQGALIGIATSKLKDYIEEFIPGFKQEFMKAQSRVNLQNETAQARPGSTFYRNAQE